MSDATPPPALDPHVAGRILPTSEKALQVNLDRSKYGTIAEIGAGQEVARWFFKVGGASGTIAKTMSAYDMVFSDAIYGTSDRYVSRDRLRTMLSHEFGLLTQRLGDTRGHDAAFFAFADTVATRSYTYKREGHGWMGIRFLPEPGAAEPSQIEIHVRLFDDDPVRQQEATGILGVNLIHAASFFCDDTERFLAALIENLGHGRLEIDSVILSGPRFEGVDTRLLSVQMVELGLTPAAMFAPDGTLLYAGEALYKKPTLIARGLFKPLKYVHIKMHRQACDAFAKHTKVDPQAMVTIREITIHQFKEPTGATTSDGVRSRKVDRAAFLEHTDDIASRGTPVLVSSFREHYRLVEYIAGLKCGPLGFVAGAPSLHQLFDASFYSDLPGGLLEGMGRLVRKLTKFYIFPFWDDETGDVYEDDMVSVPESERMLYQYLIQKGHIEPLKQGAA
ncbi:MAG: TonB-dependent receptor [Bacteroidota bacterium]